MIVNLVGLLVLLGGHCSQTETQPIDPAILATRLFAERKYVAALEKYDEAIRKAPQPHVLFARANVRRIVHRYEGALEDLELVHSERADKVRVLLLVQLARFMDAEHLAQTMLQISRNPGAEVTDSIAIGKQLEAQILNFTPCSQDHMQNIAQILNISPLAATYRRTRAECYAAAKEYSLSAADLARVAVLTREPLHYVIATTWVKAGDLNAASLALKTMLKGDPDHKPSRTLIKQIKKIKTHLDTCKLHFEKTRWIAFVNCVLGNKTKKSAENEDADPDLLLHLINQIGSNVLHTRVEADLCVAFSNMKGKVHEAKQYCTSALRDDPDNFSVVLAYAQTLLASDDLDAAKKQFERAGELIANDGRVHEGLKTVNNLISRRGKRDYYKILGIDRSADAKEIKRAYRKKAQLFHPDKYDYKQENALSKEDVLKRMMDINLANEVLSSDELRAKYDMGEDPNDPTQQQQQQGHGHGHPFHGFGGGQFHFNGQQFQYAQ